MRKEIDQYGNIFYYNDNNELHRENGPAVKYINGDKVWYKNGKRHRENGAAMEYVGGYNTWYKNGKRHREDGPAIECADGYKQYWYNDKYYSEIKTDEEWIRFVKLMVFL